MHGEIHLGGADEFRELIDAEDVGVARGAQAVRDCGFCLPLVFSPFARFLLGDDVLYFGSSEKIVGRFGLGQFAK